MNYRKVLILSQSGKGKTFSFRNMNPETTGFVNTEEKDLSFYNSFKYYKEPRSYTEAYNAIIEYAENPLIDAICLDSYSSYMDFVLAEARRTKKNFDIWNMYNEELSKLHTLIKRAPKHMFVTGHYEILGIEGIQEKRAKVKGKEFEGLIEKDYTIVAYADRKKDDKGKIVGWFDFNLEASSAKIPPSILGEDVSQVPNDCQLLLDAIKNEKPNRKQ